MHSSNFDPHATVHQIHFKVIFASRFPKTRVLSFKLGEIHLKEFARRETRVLVKSAARFGEITVWHELRMNCSGGRLWGLKFHTHDRVMGLGIDLCKPIIPVTVVIVVSIRTIGCESRRSESHRGEFRH
jgi:hypothetical protein